MPMVRVSNGGTTVIAQFMIRDSFGTMCGFGWLGSPNKYVNGAAFTSFTPVNTDDFSISNYTVTFKTDATVVSSNMKDTPSGTTTVTKCPKNSTYTLTSSSTDGRIYTFLK